MLGHFTVGKRIALFLARVSPQHAIDHLIYEAAQLLHEEDAAAAAKAADRGIKARDRCHVLVVPAALQAIRPWAAAFDNIMPRAAALQSIGP